MQVLKLCGSAKHGIEAIFSYLLQVTKHLLVINYINLNFKYIFNSLKCQYELNEQ